MKSIALFALSAAGLVGFAAPAFADDVAFGWTYGGSRGDRGFFDARRDDAQRVAPARPLGDFDPAPHRHQARFERDRRFDEPMLRSIYIPAHQVIREERVCEPALYEDRVVPVFEVRPVPVIEARFDPRARRSFDIQIGVRMERVRVGERVEHVLVREATCRIVPRVEWVPGRYVMVRAEGGRVGRSQEILSEDQVQAELASFRGMRRDDPRR